MESEARLVMRDGGLPAPVLQYEVVDGNRELRRLDFAWPFAGVAAEYDGEAAIALALPGAETDDALLNAPTVINKKNKK